MPAFQYFMEYGFFGFTVIVLWVVFDSYIDISTINNYHVVTEYINDSILMIQDWKIIFANPACNNLLGMQIENSPLQQILESIEPGDREKLLLHFTNLIHLVSSPEPLTICLKKDYGEKVLKISYNLCSFRNKPAILAIIHDIK